MTKKRILIPIVGQGSIVHIIRTGILQHLKSFCEPVVILSWQQDDLIAELNASGVETHLMPTYDVSAAYKNLRSKIDYWYKYFKLKTPSTTIQKKYYSSLKPGKYLLKIKIKETLLSLKLRLNKGYIKKLVLQEDNLLKNENTYKLYESWIDTLNADGIFTVTPFLLEVELVARLLKNKNAQLIASIHSFDNVTKRGWPAIFFDTYFVWNKYNKAELERINQDFKTKNNINILGAPQFDFHYDDTFCWSKAEWCEKLGLPADKKIILYAGGSKNLLPNEPQYVKHLVEYFEQGLLQENAIILFRCHPLDDIKRWKEYIGESPFLYYDYKEPIDRKLDYNNVTTDELRRLVSTLKHTDVHISVCSTMTVDGSVFNKPQLSPYYDDINKLSETHLRAIYRQEHYLPIIESGVLNFAENKNKLFQLVVAALNNPNIYNKNCGLCVEKIITYSDGQSTKRVAAALKQIIA